MAQAFAPIFGTPCWHVRKGHGSFLTAEFGAPQQIILEPEQALPDDSPSIRESKSRRRVHIVGTWHLWVQYCDWRLLQHGRETCHSESPDKDIAAALLMLDGQKLVSVDTDAAKGTSRFQFDLGGTFETARYTPDAERGWDGDEEQWMLYAPGERVFSYYGNGQGNWLAIDNH